MKSTDSKPLKSFQAFWPFYVAEHSHPLNRQLHFIGTALALCSLGAFAATRRRRFLALAPVAGYFFAWLGHFGVEKNRPATFTYPGKSLLGDFKMFGLMFCGKMDQEIQRLNSASESE